MLHFLNGILSDACQGFRELFLEFFLHLPRDLDALRLRRAGTVHGLGQVAYGVAAQSQVFDQAQNTKTVLDIDVLTPLEVFADLVADLRAIEVLLRRRGDQESARDILCEAAVHTEFS